MSKTKEQAQLEAAIKKGGIETANVWLQGAMKGGPEQVGNNLEMLYQACTFFLATYAVNKSKPECFSPPVSTVKTIMETKESIEDYADMMNKDIVENSSKVGFFPMEQ